MEIGGQWTQAAGGAAGRGFAMYLFFFNLPDDVCITSSRKNAPTFMLTCDTHTRHSCCYTRKPQRQSKTRSLLAVVTTQGIWIQTGTLVFLHHI